MPVANTWNERELPVLEAIYQTEELGERLRTEGLVDVAGLDLGTSARTVKALVAAEYISGHEITPWQAEHPMFINLELRERGRRAIGQWPADAADAFVTALNRLIAVESDPEERGRLGKLRDAASEVGKNVLAGAIVAAAQAGLS